MKTKYKVETQVGDEFAWAFSAAQALTFVFRRLKNRGMRCSYAVCKAAWRISVAP